MSIEVTKSDRNATETYARELADYFELGPDVGVFSWSPEPAGTVRAKCTQVHVHVGKPPGPVFVLRLKTAAAVDAVIEALQEHRKDVFG